MVDFNTARNMDFGFNYNKFGSSPVWDQASKIDFNPQAFDPKTKLFGDSSSGSDPSVGKWQRFGESMRMAGDVWNRRGDGYGYGSDRAISSIGGGGVQQQGDLTFVYPQTFSPFTIAGTPGSPSKWGKIGALAGGLLAAPFTLGTSLAAAAPIIGAGMSIGGTAGSVFD